MLYNEGVLVYDLSPLCKSSSSNGICCLLCCSRESLNEFDWLLDELMK